MKENIHKRSSVSSTSFQGSGNRLTAGARGPISFQNISLHKKMTALNQLKSITANLDFRQMSIISTEIYATGSFKVTNDSTDITKARIFAEIGKELKVLVRISKNRNEIINSDPERNPIEFAIKFFTEDGDFDLITKNIPVKLLSDSEKIDKTLHPLTSDSEYNSTGSTEFWDFVCSNPESLHNVLIMMSDQATPVGYRHMSTYGEQIFGMTNAKNEKCFVKLHLRTMQGIRNFTGEEALELHATDPDFANRDFVRAIDEKDFPKWELKMQVMSVEQADECVFNPFDPTKNWPQKYFPLVDIGEIELNEIPENYSDVEKTAFNRAFEMEGINHAKDDYEMINEDDHYSQPQLLFNWIMNDYNRENLIHNIVNSMLRIEGKESEDIIARQICHFFRVDVALGSGVAKGLGVNLISVLNELKKQEKSTASSASLRQSDRDSTLPTESRKDYILT